MAKKIEQSLELWNVADEPAIQRGTKHPVLLRARADNGSVYTVLPQRVAESLHLVPSHTVRVRYADGRRARRQVVCGLRIRVPGMAGRVLTTDALVEPGRRQVLLGCEELERMELVADHKAGVLLPRPGTERGIVAEV